MADVKRCERRDNDGRRCVIVGPCPHSENLCMFSVPTDAERCGPEFYGRCLRVKHTDHPHWYEGGVYRYATPAELAEDAKPTLEDAAKPSDDTAPDARMRSLDVVIQTGPQNAAERAFHAWYRKEGGGQFDQWWAFRAGYEARDAEPSLRDMVVQIDATMAASQAATIGRYQAEVAALTERLAVQARHIEELRAEIASLTSAGAEPTPEDAEALGRQRPAPFDGSIVICIDDGDGERECCWYGPNNNSIAYASTPAGWRRLGLPQPVEAAKPAAIAEADVEFVRALEGFYVAHTVGATRNTVERAAWRAVEAREASRG